MNFCLNRDTKLYHLKEPVFDKKKVPAEAYITCLNPGDYMAIQPIFSNDFSRLLFVGRREGFISHTANFQLMMLKWPPSEGQPSDIVIDTFKRYPSNEDSFSGLYGYHSSFGTMNFIGDSNRFAVFESQFKESTRIYAVDLDAKEVQWLNFLK